MTGDDRDIAYLFRTLDQPLPLDEQFGEALWAELLDQLQEPPTRAVASLTETSEINEVHEAEATGAVPTIELVPSSDNNAKKAARPPRRLLAAAALVLIAGLGVFVAKPWNDSTTTTSAGPPPLSTAQQLQAACADFAEATTLITNDGPRRLIELGPLDSSDIGFAELEQYLDDATGAVVDLRVFLVTLDTPNELGPATEASSELATILTVFRNAQRDLTAEGPMDERVTAAGTKAASIDEPVLRAAAALGRLGGGAGCIG